MTISVVVPTFNRRNLLSKCLAALLAQNLEAGEIIVVDDGSTDGTEQTIREEFPEIHYLLQTPNRGPAAARNKGIRAAHGEIIAFTDDDCVPPPNWLSQLAAGFEKYPQVVGVGGYQEAPDPLLDKNPVAKADSIMRVRRWGENASQVKIGGNEIPGLGTNNVAYRKRILEEVSGFDETFPGAAGEDADLKLRISQAGYEMCYLPIKIDHARDYTMKSQWSIAIRRGIGAYHFEKIHSKSPGTFRIALRIIKRILITLPDFFRVRWQVAFVILMTRVGDGFGQLFAHWKER